MLAPRPSNLFHGNAPHSGMSGRRARGEAPLLLDKLWTNARKNHVWFGAKYSVLRAEYLYLYKIGSRSWSEMFVAIRCPSAFVVGDVQMSLGVRGRGCSDVPRCLW